MSASRKEYDPLSGLFGAGPASPLPDVSDGADDSTMGVPEPGHVKAIKPVVRAPAPVKRTGPDPAQLAKILARAAAAKAGAPARPAPRAAPADTPGSAATPAANKAAAPAPGATQLSGRAIPGPNSLRRVSAAEAMKASAPEPSAARPAAPAAAAPAAAPAAAAKPVVSPAPTPQAKETPKSAPPGGRLAGVAAPPRRSMSATEALEAARTAEKGRSEQKARPAAAPAPAAPVAPAAVEPEPEPELPVVEEDQLTDQVQRYVGKAVPGAPLYVATVKRVDDRAAVRASWKGHRARLLAVGEFVVALQVTAVVQALADVPAGALAAALVVRDGGDLLVWFDLRDGRVLAAFESALDWGITFD